MFQMNFNACFPAWYPSCFSQDSMEYVVSSSRALQTSIDFLPGSTPGPLLRIISRSLYLGHSHFKYPALFKQKTNPNCKIEQFLKFKRVSLSSQGREWVRAWMLVVVQLNLDIFFQGFQCVYFDEKYHVWLLKEAKRNVQIVQKKVFFLLRKRQS